MRVELSVCGLHEAVDGALADLTAVFDPLLDGVAEVEPVEDARECVLLGRLGEGPVPAHDGPVAYREHAYVEFRRRPDPARAAGIALTLCVHYRANIGNAAASAGWLARATRLVEEFALEDVRGWLMLMQAEDAEDPDVGENLAHQSRSFARQSGDLDLELCALAQIGSSLVKQGRVKEGLPYLDEAMAGSLAGEGGDFDTVVFTSCNMIGSCVECAEFERAVQWVRAADRFTKRYGCPFLYVYCRTLYGRVLVSTGNSGQAESELTTALRESRAALPPIHALASAALGELRLAQAGSRRRSGSWPAWATSSRPYP
jgi:hypothetical protein